MLLVRALACFQQANISVAPREIWPHFAVPATASRPALCDAPVSNGKVRLQFQTPEETLSFLKPTSADMGVSLSEFMRKSYVGTTAAGEEMSERQFTELARRVLGTVALRVYWNDSLVLELAPARVFEARPLDGSLTKRELFWVVLGCSLGGGLAVIAAAACLASLCCKAREARRDREHELRLAQIKAGRQLEPLPEAAPRSDAELQLLQVQALELQRRLRLLNRPEPQASTVPMRDGPGPASLAAGRPVWMDVGEDYKWL